MEQVASVVNVTHPTENLYREVKLSSVNLRFQLNSAIQAPFHWNLGLALVKALFGTLPVFMRLTEELGAPNLNSCSL